MRFRNLRTFHKFATIFCVVGTPLQRLYFHKRGPYSVTDLMSLPLIYEVISKSRLPRPMNDGLQRGQTRNSETALPFSRTGFPNLALHRRRTDGRTCGKLSAQLFKIRSFVLDVFQNRNEYGNEAHRRLACAGSLLDILRKSYQNFPPHN